MEQLKQIELYGRKAYANEGKDFIIVVPEKEGGKYSYMPNLGGSYEREHCYRFDTLERAKQIAEANILDDDEKEILKRYNEEKYGGNLAKLSILKEMREEIIYNHYSRLAR